MVSLTWVSNMLGTVNPVAEIAAGRTRSARSSSSTPPRPRRRCRSTWPPRRRLPRLHRPQGPRPHRHRRALGPQRPARAAPAVPRRWRDDRDRHDGAVDLRRHPHRFEAGTPPIVEAVGLGAALDYLVRARHGQRRRATSRRSPATPSRAWPGAGPDRDRARPTAHQRGGAIAFEIEGVHPHDVSQVLDSPRHRRPRRAPLRQAGAQAVRRAELDPRVVVPVHDAGRDRRARRRPGVHQEVLQGGLTHGPRLAVPGDHPRPLQAPAPRRACGSRTRPRCTT